jgi:hypothetical protein
MQRPVAALPGAHRVPFITDQEEPEEHAAIIVNGRQSGDPADLLRSHVDSLTGAGPPVRRRRSG